LRRVEGLVVFAAATLPDEVEVHAHRNEDVVSGNETAPALEEGAAREEKVNEVKRGKRGKGLHSLRHVRQVRVTDAEGAEGELHGGAGDEDNEKGADEDEVLALAKDVDSVDEEELRDGDCYAGGEARPG
jgi:hypothetical protein